MEFCKFSNDYHGKRASKDRYYSSSSHAEPTYTARISLNN